MLQSPASIISRLMGNEESLHRNITQKFSSVILTLEHIFNLFPALGLLGRFFTVNVTQSFLITC